MTVEIQMVESVFWASIILLGLGILATIREDHQHR